MKDVTLDSFIEDRMKENGRLFTIGELECIRNNKECVKKIYMLGFIHAKECYEKQE